MIEVVVAWIKLAALLIAFIPTIVDSWTLLLISKIWKLISGQDILPSKFSCPVNHFRLGAPCMLVFYAAYVFVLYWVVWDRFYITFLINCCRPTKVFVYEYYDVNKQSKQYVFLLI